MRIRFACWAAVGALVRGALLPTAPGLREVPPRAAATTSCSARTARLDVDLRARPLFAEKGAVVSAYGVGQVDLPEGPRIQAILVGGADEFEIGMELELDLETLHQTDAGDDVVIYRFKPGRDRGGVIRGWHEDRGAAVAGSA